ncbi:MAG TPA: HD domain-containing phosphohydrolase [Bryobacteraceae bacterium]|jgi:putative two-component system response regulator|nr:HD domain-containing phosphohydrolase [Bryobacteraceae bacterium]
MASAVYHDFPERPRPPARHSEAAELSVVARAARILLVDSSPENTATVRDALRGFGHEIIARCTSTDALSALGQFSIDLVLIDMAGHSHSGLDLCRTLKRSLPTQLLPVYVMGRSDDPEDEVLAIEAGADEYLLQPLRPRTFQARIQASLRHRAMIDSLDDSEAVLFSLAQSVEERDPDLGQHCHRLALMGAAMGLTLGLPGSDILALQRGGYLHDIGKVAVPDHVLFKPGSLSTEEWEIMKGHADKGARICSGMKTLAPVLPIIRHHHERWDGSGYPDGLRGENIPLLARILQLADIYDALTTERPYKKAMTPEEALATVREEARRGWRDPRLVEMFADILPTFRSTPFSNDHSHFSLHALAASVERFRSQPEKQRASLEEIRRSHEFRLVSGF